MSAAYQIKVKGHLDLKLAAWFGDFAITHTRDGDTLFTGVADQAALHGALARCRDLGITLISINPLSNRGDQLMNWIHAEASQVIDARAEELYAIVRDYNVEHPAILPKEYFTNGLTVEKGGVGAGTILHSSVTVMGREYPFRQIVSEPELGRVIVETDIDTGQFSKFIFEPLSGGKQTRVTIACEFPPSGGLMGVMERLTKAPIMRKMLAKELQNLADYVASKVVAHS